MTSAEWHEKWKYHLAGLALFGQRSEKVDGPITRARRALNLTGEIDKLLNEMWEERGFAAKVEAEKQLIAQSRELRDTLANKLRDATSLKDLVSAGKDMRALTAKLSSEDLLLLRQMFADVRKLLSPLKEPSDGKPARNGQGAAAPAASRDQSPKPNP